MTAEERLDDLERWLLEEYNATLDIWAHATESPAMRASFFAALQAYARVARRMIAGRDDLVPLFDERLIPFAQHVDFVKQWEEHNGESGR